MIADVVTIARQISQVDPADKCDRAVDHDCLLMMAVQRVLARIRLAPDTRSPDQCTDRITNLTPSGMKDR